MRLRRHDYPVTIERWAWDETKFEVDARRHARHQERERFLITAMALALFFLFAWVVGL